ncbi:MAG: hypothetical protein ACRC6M_09670 [Microcystaceae cyanobacterium]
MTHTVTRSIDFKGLAQRLYKHLQSDGIAVEILANSGNPSDSVNCVLEDEVLRVNIHLIAPPSLEANAIFSCTKEFLEKAGVMALYEVKIHLIVDENNLSPSSNQLLFAPLSTDFPKQSDDQVNPLAPDWSIAEEKPTFFFSELKDQPFWIVPSLAIALGVLFLGGYALTRPCVVGDCPAMVRSKQLTQSALIALNVDEAIDWLTTQQQLKAAIQLLEPIPFWSRFHGQATQLTADYQNRLQTVQVLNLAVRQTQQAQGLIQQTAVSAPESNEAISLLQQAITTFRAIPQANAYSPFVQKQLALAQQFLFTAQQRLLTEKQAEEKFNRAAENAVLARIRGSSPQSLNDLKLIAATWKSVIQNLQQVAPNTTFYDRAKKQLVTYNQAYRNVEIRKQQETMAQLNYQNATAIAQVAEKASLENQWSISVTQWQKAIAALKSIPTNSFLAEKSRLFLTSYNLSLQQAQSQLKTAVNFQKIKQQLENLCSQWIRTCDYTISFNTIRVRLTPAYVKQIWDSALQAKTQGNVVNQTGVLNHISHLEQTLQNISNQSGLPLELYHAKGNRLSVYKPNP